MADAKISELGTLGAIDGAADFVAIVDTSGTTTNKATPDSLLGIRTINTTGGLSGGGALAADLTITTPLTTKGDLFVHDGTTGNRLAVGTDGQILEADSGQTEGLTWSTRTTAIAANVLASTDAHSTGDNAGGEATPPTPNSLNGKTITRFSISVDTAPVGAGSSFMLHNVTQGVDVLSANIALADGVSSSTTTGIANGTVNAFDRFRIDIDGVAATTPANGLQYTIELA